MNKKIFKIFLVIYLFNLFLLYSYVNSHVDNRVGESPDENLQLFFSKQITERSSIFWHSGLNEQYNTTIFEPRASIDIGNNNFMGPYLGFQLILSVSRLFGFLNYITSLIAILGLLSIYLLCREIYNDLVGLTSIVLFGLFPSYVYFANMYYNNVSSFTFAMLSIYFFYKGINRQNKIMICISGFFLSFAVHIRITEIMFIIPIIIIYLLSKKNLKDLEPKIFIPGVLTLVGTLSLWYIVQQYIKHYQIALYNTSIQLVSDSNLVTNDSYSLIKYLFNQFIENIPFYPVTFKNFIFGYSPLLFSLFLLCFIYLYKYEKILKKRIFLYSLSTLCLVFFLFYGYMGGTWSYSSETWKTAVPISSSMARYFLPLYAIFCIQAAILLHYIHPIRPNQKIMLIATLIIIFTVLNISILQDTTIRLNNYGELNKDLQKLPKKSVVFTKFYDKVISLDRNVAVYRTYEDFDDNPDLKNFFAPVSVDKDMIPLIDELLTSKFSVYIANDADDLLKSFKSNNKYKLEPMFDDKMIYQVKRA